MADLTAQRTLVKSPPELWSELSEVESLAKHLGELGEIRITKVEPESTVAWEGEEVSGTVELEQSGWGTKVTFRATVPEPGPAAEAEPEPVAVDIAEPGTAAAKAEPEPVAVDVAEPGTAAAEPGPEPEPEPEPEPIVAEAPEPRRQGFFARWLFRQRAPRAEPQLAAVAGPVAVAEVEPEPIAAAGPVAVAEVEPEPIAVAGPVAVAEVEPDPVAVEAPPPAAPEPPAASADTDRVQRVLDGTLEALGQAHHRPFSRG